MQESGPPSAAPLATDGAALSRWRSRREGFRVGEPNRRLEMLAASSTRIRRQILSTIEGAGLGHVGGDLSVTDILVTLFEAVLRIDPAVPDWPLRDRFILSKGHCAAALLSLIHI